MYSVVGHDGQVYGPVDMATLRQWIAEGRIVATTELVDPLDDSRLPAGMAPALMELFHDAGMAYPRPAMQGYPVPTASPTWGGPPKSKVAAVVMAIFLGPLGIHRFYLGHTGLGVAMLLLFFLGIPTCFFAWIPLGLWWIVDIVLVAVGGVREANGRELGP